MFLVGTEEGKIYKVRQLFLCSASWDPLDLSTWELQVLSSPALTEPYAP